MPDSKIELTAIGSAELMPKFRTLSDLIFAEAQQHGLKPAECFGLLSYTLARLMAERSIADLDAFNVEAFIEQTREWRRVMVEQARSREGVPPAAPALRPPARRN